MTDVYNKQFSIEPTASDSVFVAADANVEYTKTGNYMALESTIMENTGLATKQNVKVYANSPLATMSMDQIDAVTLRFNSDQKSVAVSFQCINGSRFATLASFASPTLTVELPDRIFATNSYGVRADLDYTAQLMVRRLMGSKIQCGSREVAIRGAWRRFRTLLKHHV